MNVDLYAVHIYIYIYIYTYRYTYAHVCMIGQEMPWRSLDAQATLCQRATELGPWIVQSSSPTRTVMPWFFCSPIGVGWMSWVLGTYGVDLSTCKVVAVSVHATKLLLILSQNHS